MRSILFSIFAALLVGCATTAADPIDQLVTRLSTPPQSGLWQNGLFPIIKLPATASTNEVLAKVLERQVDSYKVLKIRQVHIPGNLPDLYTAVLIQTSAGEKIVLFKYEGEAVGWWSRIYDAKESA
jgi:hypothetical protein